MSTQTANIFDEMETELEKVPNYQEIILETQMPPFQFRNAFRTVLLYYFEKTNKRHGSYALAEQQTKEYFEREYNIPQEAWNYRTRKN